MKHTDYRRMLIHAGRVLLSAALVAALTLVAPPPPALAAVSFTDLGACGLPAVYYGYVAWGDYDGDGDLDVAIAGQTGSTCTAGIYRNDGGQFTDIGAGLPGACATPLAWGDYDADGDLDLLFALSQGMRVYRNNGDGTFTSVALGVPGVGYAPAAWGDYDNDGDLDITAAGKVYRNDGGGVFTHVNAGTVQITDGTVAWGDYDNDGDLDLLVCGTLGDRNFLTRIYRNDGNDTFTDIAAGLPGVVNGGAVWGDYDNDGDLDIALTGNLLGALGYDPFTEIFRNDGGGVFTDIDSRLQVAGYSAVAWGDYDNDGDLDILLSGGIRAGSDQSITKIYRNAGGGAFTDSHARLEGVNDSAVAWGDYDGDGDLDALVTGKNATQEIVIHLYRSGGAPANTPPSSPTGLTATVDGATANLGWSAATDAQTPAAGLTYNLRVGTAPGAADVLAPMADLATGRRWLPQMGNAGHGTTARLTLGPGTYYWSVQAIDSAFAGGPFAAEGTFAVPYAPAQVSVAGPAAGGVNVAQPFTATVSPAETTLPLTYTWQATGQQTVTHPAVPGLTDLASFTWAVTGRKGVTVTATNALGTASGSYSFTVYPPPQAGFTGSPTVGPAPLTVAFTNTSSGEITGRLWEFGDAITSTLQGPTHTYTLPAVYTVTLTVTGPGGSDVATKPSYISAHVPSEAAFTAAPTAGIAPLAVAFTNTSTGDWTACQWWFGDGITSTLDSPTHTYSVGGTYTVTLTVDGPGGSDTETRPGLVTAYQPVDADFVAVPFFGPAPFTAAFTNTSTGDWTACEWEFGDAITSTLESPTHTYTIPGTYTVTLMLDGPGGHDVKTSAEYIHVYVQVQAGFSATPTVGAVPMAVVFTNTSTGDYIASDWAFGDGITSTLESPTHTYMLPGVYTVTLTASGPGGSDAEVKPGLIAAYPPVLAGFDAAPTAGPAPLTVVFTNTSTGEFTASLWDFGDALTSTLPSPTHTYTAGGVYTVTLTISGPHDTDTRVASRLISAYAGMPEPGPQRTDLSLQDLGPAPAPVNLAYTGEEGGLTRRYDLGLRIPVKAAHRIAAAELEPAVSGAWAGSAQVLSTQPLATVVQAFWEYPSGPRAAAAYAGPQAPATTIHLPFLGFLDGLLGRIVVQNAGEAEAHLAIHFHDRRGVEVLVHGATVPPHAERSFSLAVLQPDFAASGGYGSARIVSDRDVVAVAVLNWGQAAEAYAGVAAGETALWLPGFTRRQVAGGWDHSQAAIHNLGTVSATVHLELIDPDGSLRHALDDEIPARGAAAYNTCEQGTLDAARFQALAAALGTDWQGTLKVTCTNAQPLAGFALGWAPGVGVTDTLGYNAIPASGTAGKGLAFPAVSRRLTGGADEEWSLALVHNTAGISGTVGAEFFGADGAKVGGTYTIAIPANGSLRLSLKGGLDLPQAALDALGTGFAGCMYLTPSTGVQLAGVAESYWPGEGRASGYAGTAVP